MKVSDRNPIPDRFPRFPGIALGGLWRFTGSPIGEPLHPEGIGRTSPNRPRPAVSPTTGRESVGNRLETDP